LDLARLAHELRTPLGAIAAMAEVMRDERLGPLADERYRGYAADIHNAARHANQILSAVMASPDSGLIRPAADAGPLAVDDELLRLTAGLSSLAHRHGLTLKAELTAPNAIIQIDERAFRQIVLNLVSNAFRFTPPGGRVAVSTERTDRKQVTIAIKDNGDGMTAAQLVRIRSALTPATPARHGGLGLPIVRSLVELSGGTVTVDSAPGRGTEISLLFPTA
jgi:signal transduction histidine kinase